MNRSLRITVAILVGAGSAILAVPAGADDGDIVINEIMYHPSDAVDIEFLELHNTGSTPVDLSGWCFTEGIDLCFAPGTPPLLPDAYALVSDNVASFAAAYPGAPTPLAQYDGGLKNGGETVTLANGATVIDTVDFDDEPPWPLSPDGDGPSLEAIDPSAPNQDAANWGASISPSGHTAGFKNSLTDVAIPGIDNVTANPAWPETDQDIVVSAALSNAQSANLIYRRWFGSESTLTMDDGPNSVGGAGDGVWSATIAGQGTGTLVRYRIEATNADGVITSPSADGTINYHGLTVRHHVSSALPIIEWFMEDAVYEDMVANHRFDDVEAEAVIAFGGVVIDNATMRIRGNSSRNNTKVNWKVEFPKGHDFEMPGFLEGPIDEFNLQGDRLPLTELGWITSAEAGEIHPEYFKVRTQRNGAFWAIGSLSTNYDGTFRDNHGYDDWAVYKAESHRGRALPTVAQLEASGDWKKKERKDEDFSDIWELTTMLDAPASPEQKAWMLENLNIPRMINYAAVLGLLRHSDSSWSNYYVARDTADTGRWEMWMWDIDQTFVTDTEDHDGDFLTPAANEQRFMVALMNYPEFRQMYMRRLRTLEDQYLAGSYFEDLYDSIAAPYLSEAERDRRAWGGYSIARKRERVVTGLDDRRSIFNANRGAEGSGLIPPSASGATPVIINELNYDPAGGGDLEFIELYNTSSTESIDLSGWTVSDGVSLTFPEGSVILPNSYALLVDTDSAFRNQYGATHFVVAEYSGGLKNSGETIELRTAAGSLVDSLTWSNTAPWPTEPGGNGPSLSRLNPASGTNDPSNWAPSQTLGGTPGTANDGVGNPGGAACTFNRDGTNITVNYSNVEWASLVIRRSVDGGTYRWRTRIDGTVTGTYIDSDRPDFDLAYRIEPAFGISGTPIPCTEGDDPPLPTPRCTFHRDGTNISVAYNDIEWTGFSVRRSVNNSAYYWRTRIDNDAAGIYVDTDRPGTAIAYRLEPAWGLAGDPLDCTSQ